MMDLETLKKAKPGAIIPIIEEVPTTDAVGLFSRLSDYGRRKHSLFFESADFVERYGEKSIGSANPSLHIVGRGEQFQIKALNQQGLNMLHLIKKDFKFCDSAVFKKGAIAGKLIPKRKMVSEDQRLKLKTHIDILRTINSAFKQASPTPFPSCGLFGAFSFDFIDQFEDLPKSPNDPLNDPDYEFYYLDNLFLTNHKEGKTYIVVNAIVTNEPRATLHKRLQKTIESYKKAINAPSPKVPKFKPIKRVIETDTPQEEFRKIVLKMKEHIINGDIVQVVPSRTIITNYNAEPLDIYKNLRRLNPSPYMFYINGNEGILLGASPEMSVRVSNGMVQIRPIAGTKPRGIVKDKIDEDLDSKYEVELKTDPKELAEHTMLVDLARNDVARVSKAGTRYVDRPFFVEKYSHVQHLVSNVRGELKENLDALHAYLASMNMGTLTGCPKVMATKLIRLAEKNKRGFYGGAVGYLTSSGEFDSAIIIRSMRLKNKKAHIRAGAGIVFDSIPESEFIETEKKAQACLRAIELSGGFK
ncbi:MAG TPA: anthranilate synthase component 1 [Candidatus Nanoarchaeia archaeon]|nr:anthranilate synthase component 1 [Candidatus Nanoarchaeia archaeon]